MLSRCVAILLAIVGLYLSAFDAAAQPRGGGWGARGGFGGRFGAAAMGPRGGFRGYGAGPFAPGRARMGGYRWGGAPFGGYSPVGPPMGAPRAFGGPGPGAFGGDWRGEQDEVRRAVREGRHIPLGQAIEAVRRRAPGRELDAGLEPGPNGRPVYRLRWAGQNGRRQDYMVDAGTGAVLGVQGGP
jgi:hypothetical protein